VGITSTSRKSQIKPNTNTIEKSLAIRLSYIFDIWAKKPEFKYSQGP
jgi:hypothetical protein